jgi:NADH-quinone oxidoreductase subunit E
MSLYPHKRSALIPLCHLAQEQDGWLTPEAADEIAEMLDLTPAEVVGTASFYDMLHTEPVGKYLVSVCTNIACMLRGAYELLEHAEEHLNMRAGATSADGMFTLEEAECLADCGRAPCLQVNHRFFGDVTNEDFDRLTDDLVAGRLSDVVPPHGTLVRIRRSGGLALTEASQGASQGAAQGAAEEGSGGS